MSLRPFFALAAFIALLSAASGPAYADAKPWIWSWWPSHWQNQKFEPYLEGPKEPHNTQWDDKNWEPADWSAQKPKGSIEVIQGFYTAGILHGQDVEDDVPVLIVGPNFYHLSGYDKRRVVAMVDDYYKITTSKLNGMFTVADWQSNKPIGLYTATGLQLQ